MGVQKLSRPDRHAFYEFEADYEIKSMEFVEWLDSIPEGFGYEDFNMIENKRSGKFLATVTRTAMIKESQRQELRSHRLKAPMLIGCDKGRYILEYTVGAPHSGDEVLPSLAIAEVSSRLLKDSVSNYRGGNFNDTGGYVPYQNPYAEATVKTLLRSIPAEGYVHNSESISTRIHLNLVNIMDHQTDHESGVPVTYGLNGTTSAKQS